MKYIIGIDLGGTNTKIGIVEETTGEVISSILIKTESEKGIENTFDRITKAINEILLNNEIEKNLVIGVGLGIPGPVINQSIVGFFANFPWEHNINVKTILEEKINIPVKLDNDVNAIAAGEMWLGAAKGYKSIVCLALGTGVGGGIIVDGKLIGGFRGAGGEIGHMVVEKNGKLCGCGHKGCLEAYCSATGLIREASSRLAVNKNNKIWELIDGDIIKLEAKHIFDAAKADDYLALDILDYAVEYLAIGVGNLINIINPEIVVIGGGVSLAGDILFDSLKIKLQSIALGISMDNLKIEPAKLGNDAGVVGAAALFK